MHITPRCPYFGACGGCTTQNIQYREQLRRKRDALAGLLGTEEITVFSDAEYGYRSRVDMPFHPQGLGFRRRGRWDLIEDIEQCAIAEGTVNRLVAAVRAAFPAPDAFDVRHRIGTLRYAVIRATRLESAVTFILNPESPRVREAGDAVRAFAASGATDNVLLGYVPPNTDHSVTDDYKVVLGSAHLEEELLGLRFQYHSQGFFQANRELTEAMLRYSCERFAERTDGSGELVDLYGGVGLFGIVNAAVGGRLTVVEQDARSVQCAERNIARHLPGEHRAVARPAEQLLSLPLARPLYMVTDPPRAGMHPRVLRVLDYLQPDVLLYISCNPERLADEIPQLSGYQVASAALFDLFPQTPHYEAVVELVARSPLKTAAPRTAAFASPTETRRRVFRFTTNPGIENDVTRELTRVLSPSAESEASFRSIEKPFALAGNVFLECTTDKAAAQLETAIPALRSIYHAIEHLHHFTLSDADPLGSIRAQLEQLSVPEMEAALSFRITTNRSGDHPFSSYEVQREAGAVINRLYGTPVDLEHYELELRVDVIEHYCLIGLQRTREPLDRRFPWRFRPRVTLRTPLAFAMLQRAGVLQEHGPRRLLDPFCGSGTILVEAADLVDELEIEGSDWTRSAVEGAIDNLEACGYRERVRVTHGNALAIADRYPEEQFDYIVTNPPYGVRLGKNIEFRSFYERFLTAAFTVLKSGGRLVLLVGPRRAPFEAVLREQGTFEVEHTSVVESGGVYPSLFVLRARSQKDRSRTKYSSPAT